MKLQFDQNYITERDNVDHSTLPDIYDGFNDWVRGFQVMSEKEYSFITRVADHNANVAWVKVVSETGNSFFSVLVDRWNDNVNYINHEDLRLVPEKDKVDVLSGLVGSYPNYFFIVKEKEIGQFFEILYEYDSSERDICRLETYGANRAEPNLWKIYDEFPNAFDLQHKERKGIIDLNRYYSLAMQNTLYEGGNNSECEAIAKKIDRDKH